MDSHSSNNLTSTHLTTSKTFGTDLARMLCSHLAIFKIKSVSLNFFQYCLTTVPFSVPWNNFLSKHQNTSTKFKQHFHYCASEKYHEFDQSKCSPRIAFNHFFLKRTSHHWQHDRPSERRGDNRFTPGRRKTSVQRPRDGNRIPPIETWRKHFTKKVLVNY